MNVWNMTTLSAKIDLIVQKTAMLLQLCEALQEENDLLRMEVEALRVASERSRQLEERTGTMLVARSLAGSDEGLAKANEKKLDTKQKIDDFVREIDRCIGLLKAG